MRALVAAYAALLVALAGHVAAGGSMASPVAMALLAAVTMPVAIWVSRRPWSARELVALFLFAQAAVHLACAGSSSPQSGEAGSLVTMLGWHLVATTACVAATWWGRRCLYTAYDVMAFSLTRIRAAALDLVTGAPAAVPAGDSRPPRQWLLADVSPVRGPPLHDL